MQKDHDTFGNALIDYYRGLNSHPTITLHVNQSWEEQMPLAPFFRTEAELSQLDHFALSLCLGKILDVGAGVGSILLILQDRDLEVVAVESSPSMLNVMEDRGVRHTWQGDIMDFSAVGFDTIVLLMNGLGIAGTMKQLPGFLDQMKSLLKPDGQLLVDSSDLRYLDQAKSQGVNHGFWEMKYCYEYQNRYGEWFNWLYLDQDSLARIASSHGWKVQIVFQDGDGQYLARLLAL